MCYTISCFVLIYSMHLSKLSRRLMKLSTERYILHPPLLISRQQNWRGFELTDNTAPVT